MAKKKPNRRTTASTGAGTKTPHTTKGATKGATKKSAAPTAATKRPAAPSTKATKPATKAAVSKPPVKAKPAAKAGKAPETTAKSTTGRKAPASTSRGGSTKKARQPVATEKAAPRPTPKKTVEPKSATNKRAETGEAAEAVRPAKAATKAPRTPKAAAPTKPPRTTLTTSLTNGAAAPPAPEPPKDSPGAALEDAPLVLWAASEAIPWGTTGGLGDVAGSLPAFLRRLGWDVRLIIPHYSQVAKRPVTPPIDSFTVFTTTPTLVTVHEAVDPPMGVPTYLLACGDLFTRNGLYSDSFGPFGDNPYRFAVFARAVHTLAARLPKAPAILHCHDWHTAWLPALLHLPGQRPAPLHDTRSILTIHNLQFQGDSAPDVLDHARLPRRLWHPDWAEHFGLLMPMKAGLLSAERVTTVSPSYATEVRTTEKGFGLDGVLRARGADLLGILNGIDDESWNPATDKHLAAPFSADDLGGRDIGKRALLTELELAEDIDGDRLDATPVVAFVGRMTSEKGVDLIDAAIPDIVASGARVIVLGTGQKELEQRLAERQRQYPGRVRTILRFDAALARRIYGGADLLLVPSRTEPCGLVQFYGLRYGAVPIVHAVGGLRDTITEVTDPTRDEGGNGFVFHEAHPAALVAAVKRALAVYRDRAAFTALRRRGMRQDWSWRRSALDYERLYREVMATPLRTRHLPPQVGEPLPQEPDFGPELPARLGVTSFRLMIQSARTLYAYWETSGHEPVDLLIEERPSGRFLTGGTGLPSSGDRWLAVNPGRAYRAFLRRPDGSIAALSNVVLTPGERRSGPADELPDWQLQAVRLGLYTADPDGRKWSTLFPDAPELARELPRAPEGPAQVSANEDRPAPPGPGGRNGQASREAAIRFALDRVRPEARHANEPRATPGAPTTQGSLVLRRAGGLALPVTPEAIDLVIRPHMGPARTPFTATWHNDEGPAIPSPPPSAEPATSPTLVPAAVAAQANSAGIAFRSVLATGAAAGSAPRSAGLIATSASFYVGRPAPQREAVASPPRPRTP